RLSPDPLDLSGNARGRHALSLRLSAGIDDGVRRLRRVDPSSAAPAPQGRRGALLTRTVLRPGRGAMVWLAADDLYRPADYRPLPEVRKRVHRGRTQHARPLHAPRHGEARLRVDQWHAHARRPETLSRRAVLRVCIHSPVRGGI